MTAVTSRFRRVACVAGLLATTFAASLASPAYGASFTADCIVDVPDANRGDGLCTTPANSACGGRCSLRAAIQEIYTRGEASNFITLLAATYALKIPPARPELECSVTPSFCLPGPITTCPAGETCLPLDPSTGGLDVITTLTIVGAGRDQTIIDGTGIVGPVIKGLSATLNIEDVTIRGGTVSVAGDGGIVSYFGSLTLTDSRVTANVGTAVGIAAGTSSVQGTEIIGNTGLGIGIVGMTAFGPLPASATVTHSTIDRNSCGGILNDDGSLTVSGSTVSGNTNPSGFGSGCDFASGTGGGIENFSDGPQSNVTITNSTISGNFSVLDGGGIANHGSGAGPDTANIDLRGVTITGNVADSDGNGTGDGGGIWNSGGTVRLAATILAGNSARGGQAPDCGGVAPVSNLAPNLIGDVTGCGGFVPASGDLVGSGSSPVDPRLAPLADNGGPTKTHVLLGGSPGLDAVPLALCNPILTTDQRGVLRPQPAGGNCDIGAFESTCGNGVIDPGERCDDGSTMAGDGCDGGCQIESCWTCTGQPSVCVPAIGAPCSDGNPCNGVETCQASGQTASCQAGPAIPGCDPTQSTDEVIGSGGGNLDDGKVSLVVPPGAVSMPTDFAIITSTQSNFSLANGNRTVTVIDVQPSGVTFSQPVQLTFRWANGGTDCKSTSTGSSCVAGTANCQCCDVAGFATELKESKLQIFRKSCPNGIDSCHTNSDCGGQSCTAKAITTACTTDACPAATVGTGSGCVAGTVCQTAFCTPADGWNFYTASVTRFSEYGLVVPCEAGGPIHLVVGGLATPPGDDTLSLRGELTLAGTTLAALDPVQHGVSLVLTDAAGTLLDALLSPGAFDKTTNTGWRVNAQRTRWTYTDFAPQPPGGIYKAVLRDRSAVKPGRVRYEFRGRQGSYPVTPAVQVQVVLPGGDCFTPSPAPACTPSGPILDCR